MDVNSVPNRASDAGPDQPTEEDQAARDWNEEMAADAAQEDRDV
jgi:hypothetical protein